jgi:hypothetical protein
MAAAAERPRVSDHTGLLFERRLHASAQRSAAMDDTFGQYQGSDILEQSLRGSESTSVPCKKCSRSPEASESATGSLVAMGNICTRC